MSEGNRYVIKEVEGKYHDVGVPRFERTALAVFSTEEKAREHIADKARRRDKLPEELGQVVELTETKFREVLSRKLLQGIQYFWVDPPFEEDRLEEGIVLTEMTHILTYLHERTKSATDQNTSAD